MRRFAETRWEPFVPFFKWPLRLLGPITIVYAFLLFNTKGTAALISFVVGAWLFWLSFSTPQQRPKKPSEKVAEWLFILLLAIVVGLLLYFWLCFL
jgi:O-antigen ligase